jgi:hypothetical protein
MSEGGGCASQHIPRGFHFRGNLLFRILCFVKMKDSNGQFNMKDNVLSWSVCSTQKIVHVDVIFFATFTVVLQKPPAVQAADGNAPGTRDFSFHILWVCACVAHSV